MGNKCDADESAVLPVISAAIAAYLDREQGVGTKANILRRQVSTSGSVWALRGRELLMERRQQITVRRDKRK